MLIHTHISRCQSSRLQDLYPRLPWVINIRKTHRNSILASLHHSVVHFAILVPCARNAHTRHIGIYVVIQLKIGATFISDCCYWGCTRICSVVVGISYLYTLHIWFSYKSFGTEIDFPHMHRYINTIIRMNEEQRFLFANRILLSFQMIYRECCRIMVHTSVTHTQMYKQTSAPDSPPHSSNDMDRAI